MWWVEGQGRPCDTHLKVKGHKMPIESRPSWLGDKENFAIWKLWNSLKWALFQNWKHNNNNEKLERFIHFYYFNVLNSIYDNKINVCFVKKWEGKCPRGPPPSIVGLARSTNNDVGKSFFRDRSATFQLGGQENFWKMSPTMVGRGRKFCLL